jgi:hypothetical protein
MNVFQYRVFVVVYVIVWVGALGSLLYWRDAINYWIGMGLVALLIVGFFPGRKRLMIIFASDEKVRAFMDNESAHTREVIERARKDRERKG